MKQICVLFRNMYTYIYFYFALRMLSVGQMMGVLDGSMNSK
jgi:hypothetical protein